MGLQAGTGLLQSSEESPGLGYWPDGHHEDWWWEPKPGIAWSCVAAEWPAELGIKGWCSNVNLRGTLRVGLELKSQFSGGTA